MATLDIVLLIFFVFLLVIVTYLVIKKSCDCAKEKSNYTGGTCTSPHTFGLQYETLGEMTASPAYLAATRGGDVTVSKFANKYTESNPGMASEMEETPVSNPVQDDTTDYMEMIKSKAINKDIVKNHKSFVSEKQKYNRQPAMPDSDRDEYMPHTGFARWSVPKVGDGSRQTTGIDYTQYGKPPKLVYG
jgi:hypothetical protein